MRFTWDRIRCVLLFSAENGLFIRWSIAITHCVDGTDVPANGGDYYLIHVDFAACFCVGLLFRVIFWECVGTLFFCRALSYLRYVEDAFFRGLRLVYQLACWNTGHRDGQWSGRPHA